MGQSFQKDIELTKLRFETGTYQDPRSEVFLDGKEYLAGQDVTNRRTEVWERDKRRCVRCGVYVTFEQMHMDHVAKNYGARKWDNIDNLQTLCGPSQNCCHIGGKNSKHA